jgi:hypothetical protein
MKDLEITIYQGASFKITMTIRDSLGVRIDLTDHTFRGKIKPTFSSAAVANFSFNVYDQTVPETMGMVDITLTATQTAAIPAQGQGIDRKLTSMVYDVESETSLGEVTRWLQGIAKISPEVTTP